MRRKSLEFDWSDLGELNPGAARGINDLLADQHFALACVIGDPGSRVDRSPEIVARLD